VEAERIYLCHEQQRRAQPPGDAVRIDDGREENMEETKDKGRTINK
jgi:hypothetical protein